MSLTYPVLNEIYAVKINELTGVINCLNNQISDSEREMSSKVDKIRCTVTNQDVKIDLIHNLFNQYKASSANTFNNKDYEYLKASQANLINSIKSEYGQIVSSVKTSVRDSNLKLIEQVDKKIESLHGAAVNKSLLERISKLETSNLKLVEQINNELRSNLHNINTELANLNFRLNGLETKYVNLGKKLGIMSYNKSGSQRYEYDDNECQINDSNSMEDDDDDGSGANNWVKVTKKHKGKIKYPG